MRAKTNRAVLSGVLVLIFAIAAWAMIALFRETKLFSWDRGGLAQEKIIPAEPIKAVQEPILEGSRQTHVGNPVDEIGSSDARAVSVDPVTTNGDENGDGLLEPMDVPAWVEAHDAGLRIIQAKDPNTEPTGTLSRGNLTCDLGETPARYCIQLAALGGSLLLGEKDDRHKLNRSISMVREADSQLIIEREVTVTYPRNAQQYGFLFRRQESTINAVGVVIPEIRLARGANPYNSVIEVRYGRTILDFHHDDAAELPMVPLGDDVVLVMGRTLTQERGVRVLWLRIDERGHLLPLKSDG